MIRSFRHLATPLVLLSLAALPTACTQAADTSESATAKATAFDTPETTVSSGVFKNDAGHTSLSVSLIHLGFAPYAVQFSDVDATLDLNLENPSASTVAFDLNPNSVFSSYRGDYKATHQRSSHESWEQAIAVDFLGSNVQDTITFRSTRFDYAGGKSGTVFGDLSMNGMTKPAQFEIEITGEGLHPFNQREGVGVVAKGTIKRGDYGLAQNMNKFLGDAVAIEFSADFLKPAAQ